MEIWQWLTPGSFSKTRKWVKQVSPTWRHINEQEEAFFLKVDLDKQKLQAEESTYYVDLFLALALLLHVSSVNVLVGIEP